MDSRGTVWRTLGEFELGDYQRGKQGKWFLNQSFRNTLLYARGV